MEDFASLGLHETILQSLNVMQFTKPTPIQAQTIPHALNGSDVLGSAQTGTGKTIAYAIPLLSHLLNNPHSTAIVMTPTRELALQVLQQMHKFLPKKTDIRSVLLIGGESIFKQLSQLRTKPRLIVGTPGRINDHLSRNSLNLSKTSFVVLDEMDRMLDMGFSVQIQQILKFVPAQRQTMMFSATMTPTIVKTAQTYLNNAVRVSIGSVNTPIDKIKQEVIKTSDTEKYTILLAQLIQFTGSFIIFVKTKHSTERLAAKLRTAGHTADAIHGDLRQRNRDQVIKFFRDGRNRILVATDVASRGLDIPHIECVVNYDLPMNPEDYIHRIGRTGRAGSSGVAISLVTQQDGMRWKSIHKLMNPGTKDAATDGIDVKNPFPPKNKKKSFRNESSSRFDKNSRNRSHKDNRNSTSRKGPSSSGNNRRRSNPASAA
jgi:ATP-dependent RNA helicase DeaD